MSITHNGTKNELPPSQIPSGYVKPNVTDFEDVKYPAELTLELDKATVENVDPAITMANIFNDAAIGIDKQIADMLAAEFLGTATITAYAVLKVLTTNYGDLASTADYLKNVADKYICQVDLFVKTS